jgi:hypothetical protein
MNRIQRTLGIGFVLISIATVQAGAHGPDISGRSKAMASQVSYDGFQFPLPAWSQSGYGFGDPWLRDRPPGLPMLHTGFDATATATEDVMAAAEGTIIKIRDFPDNPEWRYVILIQHEVPGEGTVLSQYWHVEPRPG